MQITVDVAILIICGRLFIHFDTQECFTVVAEIVRNIFLRYVVSIIQEMPNGDTAYWHILSLLAHYL